MAEQWRNWSENLRFTPTRIERPADEEELLALLARAADEERQVRVVGAGHSMPPLVVTPDVLVSLERMQGIIDHDADAREATLWAGTPLQRLGPELHALGLAMENYGDVNYQALAGAIGTGTHGSGGSFGVLSTQAVGLRMATAAGGIVECSAGEDGELFRAAQVSLGALGIFTRIRLRLEPTFRLRRREWCVDTEAALAQLDEHIAGNRNFDFYWYPRRDEVRLRTLNPPEREPDAPTPRSGLYRDEIGWSHEIIPRPQTFKYIEMEYAVPLAAGPECFREVRRRIRERHRRYAAWRVLYRTVKADDTCLSIASGRDTVTMAILQNNTLPHEDYFADLESVFRAHEGRPHWGKTHTLEADTLSGLYPQWRRFQEVRRRMDPRGRFLNRYLRRLFGAEEGA